MITSSSAADGMERLGRNPRKFRRLRVHCYRYHELLSVYATPNGPVVVGSVTYGQTTTGYGPHGRDSEPPAGEPPELLFAEDGPTPEARAWLAERTPTVTFNGGAETQLCLTIDEYRDLMRRVRDPMVVDADGFAEWLGDHPLTTPGAEISFGQVIPSTAPDPTGESRFTVNHLYGNVFPQDWLVYFRCRCSQTHIGPAWLDAAMPGSSEPPRDLPGPSGMD